MSLTNLYLKPLTEKNLQEVVELDQQCLGGLWTLDNYQWEIEHSDSSIFCLSILPCNYDVEKIIGIGCFWRILEEAHIIILGIHPDFQGQGLGKLLLFHLLKDAVKFNLERATLEVKATNHIALSLYQSFGFQIAGKRKNYYQDTGEDALILWLGKLAYPEFQNNLIQWEQKISDRLKQNQLSLVINY